MADVASYLVRMFDADLNLLKEVAVTDEFGDGPGFFAHQSLHADGVSYVEVLRDQTLADGTLGWLTVLRRCDPGLDDGGWVAAAGGDEQ